MPLISTNHFASGFDNLAFVFVCVCMKRSVGIDYQKVVDYKLRMEDTIVTFSEF